VTYVEASRRRARRGRRRYRDCTLDHRHGGKFLPKLLLY